MHINSKAVETSICGALLTAVLGFSSAAFAQDEAVVDYNRYLENKPVEIAAYPDPTAAQAFVIKDLQHRISCLELTRMPCKSKEIARQADPTGRDATLVTPRGGNLGAAPH